MIFKTREPRSDDTTDPIDDSDVTTKEPSTEPEARGPEASDGDALVGAFEAIGQVVAREMATIRQALAEHESRLSQRIEAEKAASASAIGELRQDLIARMEALRQSQQKALSEGR